MIMRYEELVEKVRNMTRNAKVSRGVGHVAFQFNVEGEAEGAFYVELADGKVYVEPYEYYDRDVIIVTTADVIMQMIEGGLQPMVAYTNEQMKVYGNINHLKVLPLGCDSKQSSKVNSEQKAEYIAELLKFREAFPSGNNAANLANYKLLKDLYDRGNLKLSENSLTVDI